MTEPRNAHPLDLGGKVAIVTGGNGGIGLGIVRGLASVGCTVAIWGRNEAKNRAAVAACAGQPGSVDAFPCDTLDTASLQAALAATLERFGHIDGLFANAGIGGGGRTPFLQQTDAEWQRLIDVNLMGTKRTLSVVVARLVEQAKAGRPGGRIVITSSVAPRFGTAFNQHYAATKAGLIAIASALGVEYARYGITANALLPGYTTTEMIEDLAANEAFVKAMQPRLPMRRLGKPSDYAGIAIYLMSDLSGFHTGDAITIDGGFSVA